MTAEKLHVVATLQTGHSSVNIPYGTELCNSATGDGQLEVDGYNPTMCDL